MIVVSTVIMMIVVLVILMVMATRTIKVMGMAIVTIDDAGCVEDGDDENKDCARGGFIMTATYKDNAGSRYGDDFDIEDGGGCDGSKKNSCGAFFFDR
jgi:hypothetical protein